MKRFYTVDAIYRNGTIRYWDPAISRFQYGDIPGNLYCKYSDALREYRKAIIEAANCSISSVRLKERIEDDHTYYHILKERQLPWNKQSIESILIDIGATRVDIKAVVGKLREVAELPKLSGETREEFERISNKLYGLSSLIWNLQEKVLKELEEDV